jgi:hypothetical protein
LTANWPSHHPATRQPARNISGMPATMLQ